MVTVNVVVLAGTLATDPEFQELPSGDIVSKLRLRVPQNGKRVLPLPVSAMTAPTRRVMKSLNKGDRVMVEGHLERRFYRSGGGASSITEVVAREIKRLPDEGE
ncbi:MAG: single-stranded DNA-binding protein [Actinobacteria bacterium]|nr:single-stranded DNA-binding protein [Actinomycetota bacterium]